MIQSLRATLLIACPSLRGSICCTGQFLCLSVNRTVPSYYDKIRGRELLIRVALWVPRHILLLCAAFPSKSPPGPITLLFELRKFTLPPHFCRKGVEWRSQDILGLGWLVWRGVSCVVEESVCWVGIVGCFACFERFCAILTGFPPVCAGHRSKIAVRA